MYFCFYYPTTVGNGSIAFEHKLQCNVLLTYSTAYKTFWTESKNLLFSFSNFFLYTLEKIFLINFHQNMEHSSVDLSGTIHKMWWFYLFPLWRYDGQKLTHTHTYRAIYENHFLGFRRSQNIRINQVKFQCQNFWPIAFLSYYLKQSSKGCKMNKYRWTM